MSRSRKKVPMASVCGTNHGAVGKHKRAQAQSERAKVRDGLRTMVDPDDATELGRQMVPWDEWNCPRDGKWRPGGDDGLSEDERRKRLAK